MLKDWEDQGSEKVILIFLFNYYYHLTFFYVQ